MVRLLIVRRLVRHLSTGRVARASRPHLSHRHSRRTLVLLTVTDVHRLRGRHWQGRASDSHEPGSCLQNNPLYLKPVTNPDDPLKFHYIAHTALDIVEEKGLSGFSVLLMAGTVATKKAASAAQPDMYLGLLYPMEEYKVYVALFFRF